MNTQTTLTLETAQEKFTERFKVSAKMTEDNRKAIPGGYSRTTFNFGPHAIYAREDKGAYIETVDGHRVLDLNNNFTVNILGHSHEALQEAITAALPTGISFGNPVEEERRLADLLIDRMPSIELVRFTCSATEAAMGAVRIARAYTGKTKIAKFEGGYHRSEEHTSELQSRGQLVCRLLLEKKNKTLLSSHRRERQMPGGDVGTGKTALRRVRGNVARAVGRDGDTRGGSSRDRLAVGRGCDR